MAGKEEDCIAVQTLKRLLTRECRSTEGEVGDDCFNRGVFQKYEFMASTDGRFIFLQTKDGTFAVYGGSGNMDRLWTKFGTDITAHAKKQVRSNPGMPLGTTFLVQLWISTPCMIGGRIYLAVK